MAYKKKDKKTRQRQKRNLIICLGLIVVGVVSAILIQQFGSFASYPQLESLRKHILKENAIADTVTASLAKQSEKSDFYVAFASICNGRERAKVFVGTGKSVSAAWDMAERAAAGYIKQNQFELLWAKANVVDSMEKIPKTQLNQLVVSSTFQNFFRKGIALDDQFNVAFLDEEISGNKLLKYYTEQEVAYNMIDYEADLLHLDNINFYLKNGRGEKEISGTPQDVIVFTTQGFFCDENNQVYDLYNAGMYTGRRTAEQVDDKYLEPVVLRASQYLYDLIQPSGQFVYGYFPVFDNWMESYNIVRHSSSLWSLINLYRMTEDAAFVEGIDKAMGYMLDSIEYKDSETAYLIEHKANEIKLGGNGVAIVAITEYMDVFGEKPEYVTMVEHLANGILELQNPEDGKFFHVLSYPDYARKEAYRTVYYDGEATFALARAYTYTGQDKFLAGAQLSVENFVINDYTRYRDHWVAYALHEVTKYLPEPRYFEFALKNVEKNLDRIYNQTTSYHTYLELLGVGWETYERLLESGIPLEYLEEFDAEYFAQTLYKRSNYMLNSFFFPEYAMYMKVPQDALGAFFVRHDSFRIRIDDIQHYIGGYYAFLKNYDSIRAHLSDEFLQEMNAGEPLVSGALGAEEGEADEE